MAFSFLSVTATLALVGSPAPAAQDSADFILHGGTIITVDEEVPEAQALAARDGRIVYIGDDAGALALRNPGTTVFDLQGKTAVPGFIEGHAHFLGIGDAMVQLDLMRVRNWDEIVAMVEAAARSARPGELIRGRGWHQEKWDRSPGRSVHGLPRHDALSAVSPDNPVILTHASGHAVFANAKAMELCEIGAASTPPDGGEIVVDEQGQPIGVFRETASSLLNRVRYSAAAKTDSRRLARIAAEECLRKGVTSFQDAGSSFGDIDLLKSMIDEGEHLGVRLWMMIRASSREHERRLASYASLRRHGDHELTVGALKISIDGALGPHGAWLLEPYRDLPESAGLNTAPIEEVQALGRLALKHGVQLCVHAIGDRANRETLDLFEEAFATQDRPSAQLRWRVEHAQHLHPDDIPRFGQLGVIASMQAVHCTSDAPYVLERLGAERAEAGAYVWKTLRETGAVVSNGTDAPVEDVDPIASYDSTVNRRLADGTQFYPEQCLSRLDALRTYTLDAAFAAFEEDIKGSLTVGKLADITVLSNNLLTCADDEVKETKVLATIVGGKVLYRAE